jgi:hypothetical protein
MHRFNWFLIAALLAATPAAAQREDDELGSQRTRLGLGVGPVIAPTFTNPPILMGGLLAFEIDIPLGAVGLHITELMGGATSIGGTRSFFFFEPSGVTLGAFLTDLQLRLPFTPSFSSGFGVMLGAAVGQLSSTGAGAAMWFGPTMTLISVRIADHHELTLWAGVPLTPSSQGVLFVGVLPSLRYAYYF